MHVDEHVVPQHEPRRDERAVRTADDPAVALQVQPRRGPVGAQVLEREVRVPDVLDVPREHDPQHRLGILGTGSAEHVFAG